MRRLRPLPHFRPRFWACLVLIVAFAPARRGIAESCHALDRPVLGIAEGWHSSPKAEADPSVGSTPEAPSFRPRPCSDDRPAPPSARPPGVEASEFPTAFFATPAPGEVIPHDRSRMNLPVPGSSGLERPPRPSPFA